MLTLREARCCQSPDDEWYSCLWVKAHKLLNSEPGTSKRVEFLPLTSTAVSMPSPFVHLLAISRCWPLVSLQSWESYTRKSCHCLPFSCFREKTVLIVSSLGRGQYLSSFFGASILVRISQNSSACADSCYILKCTSDLLALYHEQLE